MSFLGFTDEAIKWYISISQIGRLITCGVPQGPILGPLLFLIYSNDMPQVVDSELLLCVGGTCLVLQHRNIKTIE